jgi:hypothetical protein
MSDWYSRVLVVEDQSAPRRVDIDEFLRLTRTEMNDAAIQ